MVLEDVAFPSCKQGLKGFYFCRDAWYDVGCTADASFSVLRVSQGLDSGIPEAMIGTVCFRRQWLLTT